MKLAPFKEIPFGFANIRLALTPNISKLPLSMLLFKPVTSLRIVEAEPEVRFGFARRERFNS